VWVVRGRRSVPARLYSLSTGGAFVATERPALRGSALGLMLELPAGRARLAGRVVMTNVPGNLARRNLPTGMAVRFDSQEADTEAALHLAIEERARELEI
jgi:Tfp pilus assembly protein PilZ